MKQTYEPYWKWEDYKNGMYDSPIASEVDGQIMLAFELLADEKRFAKACTRVVKEWPVATAVNLTNKSCNRRAWLGQAACSLSHGVPEVLTRSAWKELTNNQRLIANQIAGEVIDGHEGIGQSLFNELEMQGVSRGHTRRSTS